MNLIRTKGTDDLLGRQSLLFLAGGGSACASKIMMSGLRSLSSRRLRMTMVNLNPYGSLNNGDVRKTGPHIEWCPCKYRLGFVALALKRCRWVLPRFWSALPPVGGGMLWVACGRARLFREDCWKSVMPVMCWGIVRFLGRGLRSLRCCAPWWRSVCRLL